MVPRHRHTDSVRLADLEKMSGYRRIRWYCRPILFIAFLSGCDQSPVAGRSIERDTEPVHRIITLSPHLTELVYTAGAGDRLVGVVEYSDFPPEAKELPRVGDAFRLDYEAVAGLEPDLVLGWRSGTPEDVMSRLRKLGYRVVALESGQLDIIAQNLLVIGRLANTSSVAKTAVFNYRQELDRVRIRYQDAKPMTVFYQISPQPLFTVTGHHVIGEAIRICGGKNIFAELQGLAPSVSVEAVLDAAPEVIVASYFGDAKAKSADVLSAWNQWQTIPAVRDGNLFLVDADLMSRPSFRILGGIKQLCNHLASARLENNPIAAY